jgi:hypothetical protein
MIPVTRVPVEFKDDVSLNRYRCLQLSNTFNNPHLREKSSIIELQIEKLWFTFIKQSCPIDFSALCLCLCLYALQRGSQGLLNNTTQTGAPSLISNEQKIHRTIQFF